MKKITLTIPVKLKIENKIYSIEYKKPTKKETDSLDFDYIKKIRDKATTISNEARLFKNKYETAIELGDEESYKENYKKFKELDQKANDMLEEIEKAEERLQKDLFFLQIKGDDAEELYKVGKEYNIIDEILEAVKKEVENFKKK